ncbi:hypothetical protein [Saccharomonospora sp.]|uniref:hypothetical protein n=1 Tax=Saccharomonospora sp. TaxID=33913 RepID=UPI0026154DA1|nr:hypothetical protein [Saccharomonospora sp.]
MAVPLPSFGRNRSANKAAGPTRRRGRSAPAVDESVGEDPELSSYLAALAPENDVESTGSERRFGEAQVYQLRLSHVAGQQLKDLATELGTSPQALAQEWVLERLARETSDRSQESTRQVAPAMSASSAAPTAPAEPQSLTPEPWPSDEPGESATEELFLVEHQWPEDSMPGPAR